MSGGDPDALAAALMEACRRADRARAAAVLERALSDLQAPPAVDALGAPRDPMSWDTLRAEVKALIRAVGIEEAARRYGASADTLRIAVYRRQPPGLGSRARLAALLDQKLLRVRA